MCSVIADNRPVSFQSVHFVEPLTRGTATFELCETRTGYVWCFVVHTGKHTVLQSSLITPDTPKTAAVVLEL